VRPSHFFTQCFPHSVVNSHIGEESSTLIRPEMLELIAPELEIFFKLSVSFRIFESCHLGGQVEQRQARFDSDAISLFDVHGGCIAYQLSPSHRIAVNRVMAGLLKSVQKKLVV
jgi:hypothetical protein